MRHIPPLMFLLIHATAVAQGVVSPPHFTAVEGTSNSSLPFGSSALPLRYQQVHDDVPPRTIQRLAFRHETAGALFAGYSVTVDAWISTAAVTSAAMSATFANNHGGDRRQVVTARTVAVPANDPANLPGAFVLELPFDVGTELVFAGGSVCWEVQVTASSAAGPVLFDAVLVQSGTLSLLAGTRVGTGCRSTGRTQPISAAPANSPIDWNTGAGSFRFNVTQLLANGPILWASGLDTTQSGGLPLPLELPTTAVGPSGACMQRLDPLVSTFTMASSSGTSVASVPFVATPALHGLRIAHQVIGLDPAANAIGVTTSNLVMQQVVAPMPTPPAMARVYTAASLAPTGSLGNSNCLVVRFD